MCNLNQTQLKKPIIHLRVINSMKLHHKFKLCISQIQITWLVLKHTLKSLKAQLILQNQNSSVLHLKTEKQEEKSYTQMLLSTYNFYWIMLMISKIYSWKLKKKFARRLMYHNRHLNKVKCFSWKEDSDNMCLCCKLLPDKELRISYQNRNKFKWMPPKKSLDIKLNYLMKSKTSLKIWLTNYQIHMNLDNWYLWYSILSWETWSSKNIATKKKIIFQIWKIHNYSRIQIWWNYWNQLKVE